MAGTLTVLWNNSIPIGGPFRIAYKYPAWNGNPASPGYPTSYVMETGVACLIAGCSYDITLPIITDSACNSLTIEGYVQPECQPIDSLINRIPFSATFTPTPPCTAVTFLCENVGGCTTFDAGDGCQGHYGEIQGKAYTENFSLCYVGGVTGSQFTAISAGATAAGYSYSDNPSVCCYDCQEVTVQSDGSVEVTIQYESCNTDLPVLIKTKTILVGDTTPVNFCARTDSWATNEPAATTFTLVGDCPIVIV